MELTLVGANGVEMEYPKAPKYRPARGHLLLRKRERGVSDGGIHIVDAMPDAKHSMMAKSLREGEVLLVGEPRYIEGGGTMQGDYSIGDIVLYSEPAGLSIDLNDPDQILIQDLNVLCVRTAK